MTESLLNDKAEEMSERKRCFDEAYERIKSDIHSAERRTGRPEDSVLLLAATKTVPVSLINYAISKGIRVIGENRVQELKEKYADIDKSAQIHFIGHLQTNKVKDVLPMVSMIHSVSSIKLAEEISRQCEKQNRNMDVLIEVNVGNEESKSGFSVTEVADAVRKISVLPAVSIKGLMAIPPAVEKVEEIKPFFEKMYKLFVDIEAEKMDNVSMVYLSMGMSGDYVPAVECGANIVRIGTALFGSRIYKT